MTNQNETTTAYEVDVTDSVVDTKKLSEGFGEGSLVTRENRLYWVVTKHKHKLSPKLLRKGYGL